MPLINTILFACLALIWLLMTALQVHFGDMATGKFVNAAALYGFPLVGFLLNFVWLRSVAIIRRVLMAGLASLLLLIALQLFYVSLGAWFYFAIGGTK